MLDHVIKPFFLVFGFLLCCTTLAQTTDGPSDAVLQSCLLGTTVETWVALELTLDQRRRVKHIQEACMEECELIVASKPSTNPGDGSTILAELKNVLTKDQFLAWSQRCSQP
ncbi:MAG: hypothetical protein KDC00_07165 [Flavobacteriales bacterium]|nr:hypothetical protein [Flavobacteriales bacterium]